MYFLLESVNKNRHLAEFALTGINSACGRGADVTAKNLIFHFWCTDSVHIGETPETSNLSGSKISTEIYAQNSRNILAHLPFHDGISAEFYIDSAGSLLEPGLGQLHRILLVTDRLPQQSRRLLSLVNAVVCLNKNFSNYAKH